LYLAAVAIENAELIKNLEEARKQLEVYAEKLESIVEKRTQALKESEERRVKAERLAAIGELAASVGHDLRNPLTAINGAIYCLRMKMKNKLNDEEGEMLKIIENAVKHANKIVQDLLDFSKEIQLTKTCINLKTLIEGVVKEVEIPENVNVRVQVDEVTLHADPEQLKRVFANIVRNAVEAMPKGGELKIRSSKNDKNIAVEFKDTGIGISKENLKRIFDPLFTTKSRGARAIEEQLKKQREEQEMTEEQLVKYIETRAKQIEATMEHQ
jgi:signal transduction histidine kinase